MTRHSVDYLKRDDGDSHKRFHRGYFVWFDVPDNPACWLLGHFPRVRVIETKYSDPYRVVDCRICGRRPAVSEAEIARLSKGINPRQLAAQQLEAARRDPKGVVKGIERRSAWRPARVEAHIEVVIPRKVKPEFLVRFHLGTKGSETPVDAHAGIGGAAVFVGTSAFARAAHALTRGQGRDLSLRLHSGALWWEAWISEDRRSRGGRWRSAPWSNAVKHRPYLSRSGNVSVNPLDYLFGGPARYSYESAGEPVEARMTPREGYDGDGPYVVRWQLERQTLGRKRGPKKLSWTAAWECDQGIPVRNHDWKGDTITASSVSLTDEQANGDWLTAATEALTADISSDREHYDYTWPGAEHYLTGA